MRNVKILIVYLLCSAPVMVFGQQSLLSLAGWNLTALSGELKLGGLYGGGVINTYGIDNRITSANYYGGIYVKTGSYIWNPNFMTFDIDGGYFPESRQDLYLVSPNIYNVINTSKLHIGGTLFPRKVICLSGHINWDDSYDSRENLTDIRTNSKAYGGNLSFRNKFLPLTMAYNESRWDSREILTSRDFNYRQKNFEARATRSFSRKDNNEILYTHNDYTRRDYSMQPIRNVADNVMLQDALFLDSARRSMINSNIYGTIQKGNDSFNQLRVNENLFYRLPYQFTFNTGYTYYFLQREPEKLQQNTFNCLLGHQLFESLHSGVLFEYNNALESTYREVNDKAGLELNYTKKTFAGGLVNIQYSYYRVFEQRHSTDVLLVIQNEVYSISDRVLLKRPYVDQNSLILKDSTGTAIYQQGLDYTITLIGNFVEIQRIPGGLIPDNGKIYAFYNATQPGAYSYNINQNNLAFNWSLFHGFLDVYYKTYRTDFTQVHNADYMLLDYLTENVMGGSLKYKAATVGAEYDEYQSTLVPYTMMRYYFSCQGSLNNRFIYSINANWRDYKIPAETTHRQYGDLNGMASYAVNNRSKIDLTVAYQSQKGKQINLDMVSFRAKYSTVFRKLTCVVGVDSYDRVYLETQRTNYIGAYVQVIKKFKY